MTAAAGTAPARVETRELTPVPDERGVGREGAVKRDGLNWRTHEAGAMNRERVSEAHVHLAKVQRTLEQRSFCFGCGDLGAALTPRPELRRTLSLLAMVVGEQDPLDPFHADVREVFQHAAIAEIDQQRGIAVTQDMDVTSVRPNKEVGQSFRCRLREGSSGNLHGRDAHERKDSQGSAADYGDKIHCRDRCRMIRPAPAG